MPVFLKDGKVLLNIVGKVAVDEECCCGTCPDFPFYSCLTADITLNGPMYLAVCNSSCDGPDYVAVNVSGSVSLSDCGDPIQGFADGSFDYNPSTEFGLCEATSQAGASVSYYCDSGHWFYQVVLQIPLTLCCIAQPSGCFVSDVGCIQANYSEDCDGIFPPCDGYAESMQAFTPELDNVCMCCGGSGPLGPVSSPPVSISGSLDLVQNYSSGPCQCPSIAICSDGIDPCGDNGGWGTAPGRPSVSFSINVT